MFCQIFQEVELDRGQGKGEVGHMGEEVTEAIWLMVSRPVTTARKVHLGIESEYLLSLELVPITFPIPHLMPLQYSRVPDNPWGDKDSITTHLFGNMKAHFFDFMLCK